MSANRPDGWTDSVIVPRAPMATAISLRVRFVRRSCKLIISARRMRYSELTEANPNRKYSPSPTITAGPVRNVSSSTRRSIGPAGVSTRTGDCAMPRATAAAAATVDPVPELFVSPRAPLVKAHVDRVRIHRANERHIWCDWENADGVRSQRPWSANRSQKCPPARRTAGCPHSPASRRGRPLKAPVRSARQRCAGSPCSSRIRTRGRRDAAGAGS